jgi:predicted regulator of Ras-like GTPase activity (Roadblock/LC7/MglB family)
MSFETILQDIIDACPGCEGLALMGTDGIPIAHVAPRDADVDEAEESLGVAGVEFGRILDETRKAADSLESSPVDELTVRMEHRTVILRPVDPETTLVMLLGPGGNPGKARFLLRRSLLAIRDEF